MISGAVFDYRRVLSQQRPPGSLRGRVTFEWRGFRLDTEEAAAIRAENRVEKLLCCVFVGETQGGAGRPSGFLWDAVLPGGLLIYASRDPRYTQGTRGWKRFHVRWRGCVCRPGSEHTLK